MPDDEICTQVDFPDVGDEAWRAWDRLAPWWDERIGDGNPTAGTGGADHRAFCSSRPTGCGCWTWPAAPDGWRAASPTGERSSPRSTHPSGSWSSGAERSAEYGDRITFQRVDATDVEAP